MLRMVVLLCVVTVVTSQLFDNQGVFGLANAVRTSVRNKIRGLISKDPVVPPYPNEVYEDARLNVVQLIEKNRYPVETHNVTTSDDYILQMHRVPYGIYSKVMPVRPVVFLMHGLLSSSADWVLTGPGKGLAYILAEAGFDVWMGNARGNTYSRRHVSLNPDLRFNYFGLKKSFWRFSWDEIGNIDVPAMIDYVLANTGQQKLHYIGHSQGTTAFFVMGSLRPNYNDKVLSMHALAPVAFMAYNRNPLLRQIAPLSNQLRMLSSVLGVGELLSNGPIMSWAGQALCHDQATTQILCSNILFLIGGWNINQHNATILPSIISHTPAGASVMQFAHYGQSVASGGFRRYDHGVLNPMVYDSMQPPDYNLLQVTAPVYLHYSASDPLAEVPDVDRLWGQLGRPSGKYLIPMNSFSHLDFLWGINAKELVYDRVIDIMWSLDYHVRPGV